MGTITRRPWETATVLNQQLLDLSQDSLSQKLEFIARVETVNGTFYWSDRAKYVGDTFYENRVIFPDIERTVGEFLAGELEFSGLEIQVNNTDKKFTDKMKSLFRINIGSIEHILRELINNKLVELQKVSPTVLCKQKGLNDLQDESFQSLLNFSMKEKDEYDDVRLHLVCVWLRTLRSHGGIWREMKEKPVLGSFALGFHACPLSLFLSRVQFVCSRNSFRYSWHEVKWAPRKYKFSIFIFIQNH